MDTNFVLKVIDRGVGIPENEVARIFEKFYRPQRNGIGGTGLGLSTRTAGASGLKATLMVARYLLSLFLKRI